jgi:hypothetical protein
MALRQRQLRNVALITISFGLAVVGFAFLFASIQLNRFDMGRPRLPWTQPTEISNVEWDDSTGRISFLVRNTEDKNVTLLEIYVNDTLDAEAAVIPQVLLPNQTAKIVLSKTYDNKPTVINIKITTPDGLGAHISKRFYEIQIDQVEWEESSGKIKLLARNTGDETTTLSEVYVNGTLDDAAIPNNIVLPKLQTTEITLTGTFRDTHTLIPIKVTTLEGASAERSSPIFGVWIGSIGWDNNTGRVWALVNSNGYEEFTLNGVYVNGTLDAAATITGSPTVHTVTLSKTYLPGPVQLILKVVTEDGAWYEMAYPNFRIRIEEINWDNTTGQIRVLVQDMGGRGVTFNHVYVNGTLDEAATFALAPPIAQMYEVTLSEKYLARPSQVTVKVTTLEGSFDEKQKTFDD